MSPNLWPRMEYRFGASAMVQRPRYSHGHFLKGWTLFLIIHFAFYMSHWNILVLFLTMRPFEERNPSFMPGAYPDREFLYSLVLRLVMSCAMCFFAFHACTYRGNESAAISFFASHTGLEVKTFKLTRKLKAYL